MEPIFFLKGLIVGFAMAVPIGPVGIICIRKTQAEGHLRGLIIGLGAATADLLYAGASLRSADRLLRKIMYLL
jgi:threonine/homoserine/homoserine lactone efflux protein